MGAIISFIIFCGIIVLIFGWEALIFIAILFIVGCVFAVSLTKKEQPNNDESTFDYYSYHNDSSTMCNNTSATKTVTADLKEEDFHKMLSSLKENKVAISISDAVKKNAIKDMPEIKFTNVTKKNIADRMSEYVVIDVETTGLQVGTCEIIEVAAVRFSDFSPTECFTTLLKSKKPIPAEATQINNITDLMVSDKPYFNEIANSLSDFIGNSNLVGHNLSFDLKFLYKNGYDFTTIKRKYYDTLELSKKVFKKKNYNEYKDHDNLAKYADNLNRVENYKLRTLCKHTGIPFSGEHRALNDSLVTGILFSILVKEITE